MQINFSQNILYITSVAVLFCIIFGTEVLSGSLSKGCENSVKRLGADAMIISSESDDAEDLILSGPREYKYFPRSFGDEICSLEGICTATPQFYLSSLSQECCSTGRVSIIGFDPGTDFLIIPWLSAGQLEKIKEGQAVCGSGVSVDDHRTVKLYGTEYEVGGRLSETGTPIDSSVYFSLEKIPDLVRDAKSRGYGFISSSDGSDMVSAVFMNYSEGANVSSVSYRIRDIIGSEAKMVSTRGIAGSIEKSFAGISVGLKFVSVFTVTVSVLVLFVLNLMSSASRRRRYALLRISGLSRAGLYRIISFETFILTLAGIFFGTAGAAVVVYPFGALIGENLGMPFLLPGFSASVMLFLKSFVLMILISVTAQMKPAYTIVHEDAYTALRGEE